MGCPTCGTSLSTERGMRQHHTKVHDDPLPNRTCKGCEAEFYDPKARQKFCDDCNPNAGRNNGNWRDAQETANCVKCDSTFTYYPSNKPGIYCSGCIEDGNGLDELGPERDAPRQVVACEHCGTEMTVLCSRVKRRGVRFCSQHCHGMWISENMVGEDHHCWKGGSIAYHSGWLRARRRVLRRDDNTCQSCGSSGDEMKQGLHVHHIKPVRTFDDQREAHRLTNLVTLCPSCHPKVEHGLIALPAGPWRGK